MELDLREIDVEKADIGWCIRLFCVGIKILENSNRLHKEIPLNLTGFGLSDLTLARPSL